jgi:hypothetical protein
MTKVADLSSRNYSPVPAGLVFGFLLIAAIVFATGMPAISDYPNHLVRYWLLSGGASIAPVSSMYAVDWRHASTVGVDVFAALAGRALPYTVVGKSLLTFALVGPPAGAVCLNRIVFGRWHWWQIGFAAFAWATTALFGFLDFQVSLGAALFLACSDGFLPPSTLVRPLVRIVFATFVTWLHPFGLVFYVFLLTALLIGPSVDGLLRMDRLRSIAVAELSPILALVVPLVLLFFVSPAPPSNHLGGKIGYLPFFPQAFALMLASPFLGYRIIDILFAVPLLAIYAYALLIGRAQKHAGLLIVGVTLGALSMVMPFQIGDAGYINYRLPLMAALTLFAGVLPDPFPAKARRYVTAGLIALATARSVDIAHVWRSRQEDVRSVEAAIAHVPEGSSIFVVQSVTRNARRAPVGRYLAANPPVTRDTMIQHVPVLVVPRRHAFIASLFALPGQHPIKVLPPYNEMSSNFFIPDVHVLDGPPSPAVLSDEPYLLDWNKRFDCVMAIGMDALPRPFVPPPRLRLVADEGYARLYCLVR